MNASEQGRSLALTCKIAATVNLFKSQFPDAKADLKPWKDDADTRSSVDPDSIDIGFVRFVQVQVVKAYIFNRNSNVS